MNTKIISALKKVLAGDVLPFRQTPTDAKKQTLVLDWKDADLYPVGGNALKVIGVFLKGAGPNKRLMVSLVPARDQLTVQVDEVGGDFHRTLKREDKDKIENYLKTQLTKDLETAFAKNGQTVKVIQKLSEDFLDKLNELK